MRPGLPILDAGRHFLPHHRRYVNGLLALFQRRGLLAVVQALSTMAANSVDEPGIMRDKRAAIMLPCLN
ncbi:hypothetical protein LNP17_06645 [Klebsiella variicola subsp. variicola]|nr:hypothetical protein [Klebsiella variicola subsp. variicola]